MLRVIKCVSEQTEVIAIDKEDKHCGYKQVQ